MLFHAFMFMTLLLRLFTKVNLLKVTLLKVKTYMYLHPLLQLQAGTAYLLSYVVMSLVKVKLAHHSNIIVQLFCSLIVT